MRKTKIGTFIAITFLLLIFQQIASLTGTLAANIFDYSIIDKNNTFLWISVHHIIQMILACIAIYLLNRFYHLEFGLRFKYSKAGIRYTIYFAVMILIYVLVTYIIGYTLHTIKPYPYPLTIKNILGTLGFQLFLSGTSEELLFRALPVTVLSSLLKCDEKKKTWISVTISAVLFSFAHINWSFSPSLTASIHWFQLFYALLLGLIYGFTYRKTNSILYPMIMHGLSNVLMVGAGYLFMVLF